MLHSATEYNPIYIYIYYGICLGLYATISAKIYILRSIIRLLKRLIQLSFTIAQTEHKYY